jgi:hypothetical protein
MRQLTPGDDEGRVFRKLVLFFYGRALLPYCLPDVLAGYPAPWERKKPCERLGP